MKTVSIVKAEYKEGLKVKLYFNDHTSRTIDFEDFFSNHSHPQYNKYSNPSVFKKFKLMMGNITWGKDWDLVFPVYDLYKGKV